MVALPNIYMCRDNLDDFPVFELPAPYSVRWYKEGEERTWVNIVAAADVYNNTNLQTFREQFGEDVKNLKARQFFIINKIGKPVGTSTSWFGTEGADKGWGRIHWVMLHPEEQGKGLANAMLSLSLLKLKELGHKNAYLCTQPPRLPAIALYLKFGFKPQLRAAGDALLWENIFTALEKLKR